MYIELYKYVDGDDVGEKGEYLGYVSLEEDDIYIDIDDERLLEKIEDLFSEPLSYSRSSLEPEINVEPYTEEFFRVVPTVLPDINVRGILKEDDIEDYEKPVTPDEESEDEEQEEMEDMPVGMSMEDMRTMEDEEYGLEESFSDDDMEEEDY